MITMRDPQNSLFLILELSKVSYPYRELISRGFPGIFLVFQAGIDEENIGAFYGNPVPKSDIIRFEPVIIAAVVKNIVGIVIWRNTCAYSKTQIIILTGDIISQVK